jgi:ABC-type Fe3+-siderophore transport system permease subunit
MNKWAKVALVVVCGILLTARLYTAPPAWMFWLFGTLTGLAWAPVILMAILVPLHLLVTRLHRAKG